MKLEPWVTRAMEGVGADEMRKIFPWAADMDECEHDPVYHAEGSPWVHTCMVVEALEKNEDMAMLSPERQAVTRLAAWAHDIGKPATTVFEKCEKEGRTRIRQPGHAPLGAKMIWQSLIDQGASPALARDVHALVFWHRRIGRIRRRTEDEVFPVRHRRRTRRRNRKCRRLDPRRAGHGSI